LVAADARYPGARARRRSDPGLARPGLAAHQKKARRKGAVIIFIDETGSSYQLGADTTRAPRGQAPVPRRVSKRRRVSPAIGLTTSGRIYRDHFDHAIHGEDMVKHPEHLRHRIDAPMIIVWDGLQVHRSGPVKSFLADHPEVSVGRLPSYAPELDPEEECHGNVEQGMRNSAAETEVAIREHADRGFARLRRRPDLLLGFFRHAGLRVKRLT
jgi:hypothetical protein